MKALWMLSSIVVVATPLAGQAPGTMTVDTSVDRMSGKRNGVVRWTAVDSVQAGKNYLPVLVARCNAQNKIDVVLRDIPPVKNRMRHDIIGQSTIEDLKVDVRLDGWNKPKGSKEGDFTFKDDAVWYYNGKDGIKNLLLPTDTLLLRFPTSSDDVVMVEFRLGADSVRRAALGQVASACNWKLPS